MSDRMALRAAIDLMFVPSQVRLFRKAPLPDGMVTLLQVAAGDSEAENAAVDLTGRSRDVVRKAATFFIEQILFAPNADSYRVLGANPTASASELRRNVALLLRSLHPDLDPRDGRSIFAGRVTAAWNDLKTPERRAAYDEALRHSRRRSHLQSGNSRLGRTRFRSRELRLREQDTQLMGNMSKVGFFRWALLTLFNRALQ